jgi:protein-S-isoprenylcysteine O-methyltransferase Ste14
MPTTCLLATLLLMGAAHLLLPLRQLIVWPWRLLALGPLGLGVGLTFWSHHYFEKTGTTVRPFETSTHLIDEGPYRFSRHPMYLGMLLVPAGIAVALGSLSPFPVLVPYWLATEWFIAVEERMLEERFGERYRAYRRRVRRWL